MAAVFHIVGSNAEIANPEKRDLAWPDAGEVRGRCRAFQTLPTIGQAKKMKQRPGQ
jgi:hypothetical protein